jgi:putative hemolysin
LDYYSGLLQPLFITMNTQASTVLVVLVIILMIFSFIVSGAEVAFFSLTYKDINLLKTKQQHSYKRIIDLLEEPKILLGTLLIANSFINIAVIIISNILIDGWFTFPSSLIWVEYLIKIVAVTSLLVLFGEAMPKVMATQNNIRFAKDVGGVVEIFSYLFKRMANWLVKYSDIIERGVVSCNRHNRYRHQRKRKKHFKRHFKIWKHYRKASNENPIGCAWY